MAAKMAESCGDDGPKLVRGRKMRGEGARGGREGERGKGDGREGGRAGNRGKG